jgi:prepilin signal peptidase PulO-like enzyme (type II secretory pathway)
MTGSQLAAATATLFALGACLGSFLNVVLHRLPAGKSLLSPPSACPSCAHRIAWHDNVPILGWLALRARCRHCRNPIPARYPAVETACGLLFATLFWTASTHTGGDLLETPGALQTLALRLAIASTATTAGLLATETTNPGTTRPAAWLVATPSLLLIAWLAATP